jgi:hypothetical protein
VGSGEGVKGGAGDVGFCEVAEMGSGSEVASRSVGCVDSPSARGSLNGSKLDAMSTSFHPCCVFFFSPSAPLPPQTQTQENPTYLEDMHRQRVKELVRHKHRIHPIRGGRHLVERVVPRERAVGAGAWAELGFLQGSERAGGLDEVYGA